MNALKQIAKELGDHIWDLCLVRSIFDYVAVTVYKFSVPGMLSRTCILSPDKTMLSVRGSYDMMLFFVFADRFALVKCAQPITDIFSEVSRIGNKVFISRKYSSNTASISPDGKYLATNSELYRIENGKLVVESFLPCLLNIHCSAKWVYFIKEAKWVARSCSGHVQKLMSCSYPSPSLYLSSHFVVFSVIFGPSVIVRNDSDHKIVATLEAKEKNVANVWLDLTFSPDEKYLAVLWNRWTKVTWETWKKLAYNSPDCQHISLYSTQTWKMIGDYCFPGQHIGRILFANNGVLIVDDDDDYLKYLCLWNWTLKGC